MNERLNSGEPPEQTNGAEISPQPDAPEYWGLAAEASELRTRLEGANARRLRAEQQRAEIIQRLKQLRKTREQQEGTPEWDMVQAIKANETELAEAERLRDELRTAYMERLRLLNYHEHESGKQSYWDHGF